MINRFSKSYSFLSNFYSSMVTYKNITYRNSESAYQAQKLENESDRVMFCNLDPYQAKQLGQKIKLRSGWESMKYQIMSEVVKAKFDQNPELKRKLMATNREHLEEGNNHGDTYWGTVDGKGKNSLGLILMSLRSVYEWDELKN